LTSQKLVLLSDYKRALAAIGFGDHPLQEFEREFFGGQLCRADVQQAADRPVLRRSTDARDHASRDCE